MVLRGRLFLCLLVVSVPVPVAGRWPLCSFGASGASLCFFLCFTLCSLIRLALIRGLAGRGGIVFVFLSSFLCGCRHSSSVIGLPCRDDLVSCTFVMRVVHLAGRPSLGAIPMAPVAWLVT